MQMIEMPDLVSTTFEPCAGFERSDAAPICGGCGWLDTEHERPDAEVHALPVRPARGAAPKRLAS